MRCASLYHVMHGVESVCPVCGKTYCRTDEWVFRRSFYHETKWFCSWSCLRAYESKIEAKKQEAEQERAERRKQLPHYLTRSEKALICRMYKEGYNAQEISEETGRSTYSVQGTIREVFEKYVSPVRGKKNTKGGISA